MDGGRTHLAQRPTSEIPRPHKYTELSSADRRFKCGLHTAFLSASLLSPSCSVRVEEGQGSSRCAVLSCPTNGRTARRPRSATREERRGEERKDEGHCCRGFSTGSTQARITHTRNTEERRREAVERRVYVRCIFLLPRL
jgi:hypothetical protein